MYKMGRLCICLICISFQQLPVIGHNIINQNYNQGCSTSIIVVGEQCAIPVDLWETLFWIGTVNRDGKSGSHPEEKW